jgi:hypothetical protein
LASVAVNNEDFFERVTCQVLPLSRRGDRFVPESTLGDPEGMSRRQAADAAVDSQLPVAMLPRSLCPRIAFSAEVV